MDHKLWTIIFADPKALKSQIKEETNTKSIKPLDCYIKPSEIGFYTELAFWLAYSVIQSWSLWKPALGNNLYHGSKTKKKPKNLFYRISRYLDIHRNVDSNNVSNWCWLDGAIIAIRGNAATRLADHSGQFTTSHCICYRIIFTDARNRWK